MVEPDRFSESLPARTVFVRAPTDIGIESGRVRIGVWLVEPGDSVNQESVLAELIAPGLLLELRSPVAGTVQALRQTAGETVQDPHAVFCELLTT